jgi:hypothetical protein
MVEIRWWFLFDEMYEPVILDELLLKPWWFGLMNGLCLCTAHFIASLWACLVGSTPCKVLYVCLFHLTSVVSHLVTVQLGCEGLTQWISLARWWLSQWLLIFADQVALSLVYFHLCLFVWDVCRDSRIEKIKIMWIKK